jgi:hypothetical protein
MNVITVVGLLITSLVGLSVFNHYRVLGQFKENMIYIAGTNSPRFLFGLHGLYVSIRLILENSFAVFGN